MVAVSAKTGAGLEDLSAALAAVAGASSATRSPARLGSTSTALHDRGVGTVVTGHALVGLDRAQATRCGSSRRASTCAAQRPGARRAGRAGGGGQRVAVNLPGVARTQLRAEMRSSSPAHYPVSWRLDVALEELEPVPAAVTVQSGGRATPARVVRGAATPSCGYGSRCGGARRPDRPARGHDRRGRRRARSGAASKARSRAARAAGARGSGDDRPRQLWTGP